MVLCCILDSSTSTCTELAATLLHGKYFPGAPGASLQFLSSIFFVGLFGGFFFSYELCCSRVLLGSWFCLVSHSASQHH